MAGRTGVYPCYENQFKIGAAKDSATSIKDMESFSVSFDNGVEEWTPFDTEGWVRRLLTAKGFTISVAGKRNIGDTGNRLCSWEVYRKRPKFGGLFRVDLP